MSFDRTVLQHPGIRDQARTCLYALFGILEKNILPDGHSADANLRAIECTYKLLYQLCSHPNLWDVAEIFAFLGNSIVTRMFFSLNLSDFFEKNTVYSHSCEYNTVKISNFSDQWLIGNLRSNLRFFADPCCGICTGTERRRIEQFRSDKNQTKHSLTFWLLSEFY